MNNGSSERPRDGKLAVFCLGGLRIERDGAPLTRWASRKAPALVAYLAVTRRSHERESLATLFWDDRPTARALGNLSVLLSSLRANLGDLVVTSQQTVGLDWERDIWVDTAQLSQQLSIPSDGQPSGSALARLEQALTLYPGEFLDGFFLRQASGFEEWALLERERLRQQMLQGMEALVRGLLLHRRYQEGVVHAQRLLAYDPLREHVHRDLMRLYALDGQRAAALAQYEQCFEVLQSELGVEPDDETTALYEQIATEGDVALASTVEPVAAQRDLHNLSPALTSFVGRTAELNQIRSRLDNPACRLLTLLGPGGVGKTRLALHAARNHVGQHLNGVWFVPLAALAQAEGLAAAIGTAMDLAFSGPADPAAQLRYALKNKEALLVLDNFEHLLVDPSGGQAANPALDLIRSLLAEAPEVKLLVTSRQRLAVQAEWVLDVGGLPYPAETDDAPVGDSAAVQLLLRRGERVRSDFRVTPENQADVALICRLLGGLPLAIELAASWLRTLSTAEIAAEVERSLDILSAQMRDMPERHSSQRAVFESSWQMLSSPEQEVFRKLAVFGGGFSLEAAQTVCDATLPILSNLIDKSLMWREEGGRYHRHPLLRQFAVEKLASDPALESTCHDRHCAYYAVLLAKLAERFVSSERMGAVKIMDMEIENVRAAWRWAVTCTRMDWLDMLADSYGQYLVDSGLFVEGEAAFAMANQLQPFSPFWSPKAAARLLTWQGIFGRTVATGVSVEELLQRALAILDRPELADEDTRTERASVLEEYAAHLLHEKGEYAAAGNYYRQALTLYTQLNHKRGMGNVYNSLGVLAYYQGDYAASQQLNQESLRLKREMGNRVGLIRPLQVLGLMAVSQGRFTEGIERFQECLAYSRSEKHHTHVPWLLADLGYAYLLAGDFAQAQTTLAEGLRIGGARNEAQILAVLHVLLGFAYLHVGAYPDAEEHGTRGLEIGAQMNFRFEHAFAQLLLGSVALGQTKYAQAQTLLSAAAHTYREIEHLEYLGWAVPLLACVACKQEKWQEAAQHLAEIGGLLNGLPAFVPAILAVSGLSLWQRRQGAVMQPAPVQALAARHAFVAHSRWFADVMGDGPSVTGLTVGGDAPLSDASPGLIGEVLALLQTSGAPKLETAGSIFP